MSLGAFMNGLTSGYTTVEGIKERKDRRERRAEDEEWIDDTRERTRAEWDRVDKERSVLAAIAQESRDSYDAGIEPEAVVAIQQPEVADGDAEEQEPVVARMSTRNDSGAPEQPRNSDAPQIPQGDTRGGAAPRTPRGTVPPARLARPSRNVVDALQDQPVSQPDGAPTQVTPQRENMVRKYNLGDKAIQTARAVDIAEMEAQTGRDAQTGRALTEDEVASRVERVELADQQLSTLVQNRQPYSRPEGPAPLPARSQAGIQDIIDSTKHYGASVANLLTPSTQQQANMGPDRNGADAAAATVNAARQAQQAGAAPSGAPRRPAPSQTAPAAIAAPERPQAPAQGSAPETPPPTAAGPAAMAEPGSKPVPEVPEGTQPEQVADKLADEVATAPPDQGGAPSIELAAQTAPGQSERRIIGSNAPIKATEAQRERASKSFLDHYAQTAVPKIVEYYLSQGDIAKAEGFEQWAKSREAQNQLKSWSKALHSAALGDEDGFLDHWSDTYNSFDDGLTVVRQDSGFKRDAQGNILGATLTFKNNDTGQTFTREFEGQEDLIREGVYALAPEQVFEYMWGEIASANKAAASEADFQRKVLLEQVKAGIKSPQQNVKDVASAKKFLAENMLPGEWNKLSPEEQNSRAIDYIRQNQQAGQQLNLPAPPPLYTGE